MMTSSSAAPPSARGSGSAFAASGAVPLSTTATTRSGSASSGRNSTEGTWVAHVDKLLARVREELSVLVATSSPTTKTIAVILGVSYVLNFLAPWAANYLALVPERTLPCVWNIVSPAPPSHNEKYTWVL